MPYVGAAVVGEAKVFVKAGSGISTQANCPFTYSLDVGARLYAHITDGDLFGWGMQDFDITPAWNKNLAKSECPDLGPIPQKRSVIPGLPGTVTDNVTSEVGLHTFQKRSGVYGPAFRIPVGKFFCPSSTDDNEDESGDCSDIVPYWDDDEFNTSDGERYKRRDGIQDELDKTNIYTDDTEGGGLLVHKLEKRTSDRDSRICGLRIETTHPNGGAAPGLGELPVSYVQISPIFTSPFGQPAPMAAITGSSRWPVDL